jgi:hypothetical protein
MKKTAIVLTAVIIFTFAACSVEDLTDAEIIEQIDEEVDEIEDEVEPDPKPEPVVTTTPAPVTDAPVVTPVPTGTGSTGQPLVEIEAFITQNDDGPVFSMDPIWIDDFVDPGELGSKIRWMLADAMPSGLDPYIGVASASFPELVSMIRGGVASISQLVEEHEANLHAVEQFAKNAGVNLSDISVGHNSAQSSYNMHASFIKVIRQAIAEVEREQGVVE